MFSSLPGSTVVASGSIAFSYLMVDMELYCYSDEPHICSIKLEGHCFMGKDSKCPMYHHSVRVSCSYTAKTLTDALVIVCLAVC